VVNYDLVDDRRLEFDEFKDLIFSNVANKYEQIKSALDQECKVPLQNSIIMSNWEKIFKKLRHDRMIRSGCVTSEGITYIERNKDFAKNWRQHYPLK